MPRQLVFIFPDGTMCDTKNLVPVEETLVYSDRRNLPVLYALDSKGKKRMWKVWLIDSTVYRMYGLVDGKKVESNRIFKGKSIGKKNETTPDEQGWAEANKYWIKQLDKKYLPAEDDQEGQDLIAAVLKSKKATGGHNINAVAAAGGRASKTLSRAKANTCMVSEVEGGSVIPMKAQVWELEDDNDPTSVKYKVAKYFSDFGVKPKGKPRLLIPTDFYGQPKLDGWRARIMIQRKSYDTPSPGGVSDESGSSTEDWEVSITSNSGKQYPWFSKLRQDILRWLTNPKIDMKNILDGLDGELYTQTLYKKDGSFITEAARFSTISSICGLSRSKPHELENQIQFHCFDLFDKSGTITQKQRFKHLKKLFKYLPKSMDRVVKVKTPAVY